ncbi:hypothetical protein HMPREF1554_01444, partial [Porphyromonas gingivalis F0569]
SHATDLFGRENTIVRREICISALQCRLSGGQLPPFAENDHNPIQRRILQPASMQRQTIPLSFISVSGIFFLLGFEIYRYFMMLIEVGPNFIE